MNNIEKSVVNILGGVLKLVEDDVSFMPLDNFNKLYAQELFYARKCGKYESVLARIICQLKAGTLLPEVKL